MADKGFIYKRLFKELYSGTTHNVWIERFNVDVADWAAGQRPHFGLVLESSSDLRKGNKVWLMINIYNIRVA